MGDPDPYIESVLETPATFTGCDDVRTLEMLLLNLLLHRRILLRMSGKAPSRILYSMAHQLLDVDCCVGSAGPSHLLVERNGPGYSPETMGFYRAFVAKVLEDEQ